MTSGKLTYNKVVYEATQNMQLATSREHLDRCTGRTTFEILSLIGALHKSAGDWVNICDYVTDFHSYGHSHSMYVRDMILQTINKLGLKFIEFNMMSNQVRYSLYGKVEWKMVD